MRAASTVDAQSLAGRPRKLDLQSPVQYLKGIGPVKAEALATIGINSVEDLLYHIPRRYLDRSTITPMDELQVNSRATVMGTVESYGIKRWRTPQYWVILRDEKSFLKLVWFSGIKYIQNKFKEGDTVVASGEVRTFYGLQMPHPEFEIISGHVDPNSEKGEKLIHTGRVIPLYPSTSELKNVYLDSRGFRRVISYLLENLFPQIQETLPDKLREELELPALDWSLKTIHFPDSIEDASKARKRLAFEELFYLELLLALRKRHSELKEKGSVFSRPGAIVKRFLESLPFELTQDQRKVLNEIYQDVSSGKAMHRLLQGDVGSGKTIVALIAMLMAIENGYQTAIMAPTEVLSEQHHLGLSILLEPLKIEPLLLTSSVKTGEKKEILRKISSGEAKIIVGTHSLIQKEVNFNRLGLAVIDEQHRFGVMQRLSLKLKGESPHLLVMTATPIPRTLALTVYGDLDISVINQMPPGRKKIETRLLDEDSSEKGYIFLEEELKKGRQAYIVYPLIEESEKADLKAATEGYQFLQGKIFPHRKIALLHGRIKREERERVMKAFRSREYDILVCTTVIEVGLDVPNATLMLIEHAERFGLSQLHQLRGRIGRGEEQSYCILKFSKLVSEEARRRLQILSSTTDGFKISEADLKLRGPGEFFGTRQHGLPDFKIADLTEDLELLFKARDWAFKIVQEDGNLSSKENLCLRSKFIRNYKDKFKLADIG
ncbi:MAG: ATP-dependent DNA helicase RecG [candidate division Zixibacteria bacterium RBG_16_43_9]|nr:MAG: ATP-dependent DNA helicase RecG [candidate division Zixibacteria bacterium RBG_16_43_9]